MLIYPLFEKTVVLGTARAGQVPVHGDVASDDESSFGFGRGYFRLPEVSQKNSGFGPISYCNPHFVDGSELPKMQKMREDRTMFISFPIMVSSTDR